MRKFPDDKVRFPVLREPRGANQHHETASLESRALVPQPAKMQGLKTACSSIAATHSAGETSRFQGTSAEPGKFLCNCQEFRTHQRLAIRPIEGQTVRGTDSALGRERYGCC